MTKTERSRIVALGGIGAVIILLVWGIIATLPKKEDGREEEVRLRSVNPEKPDVPLNKNDAFQKVQKRRVQEKR